MTLRGRVVKYAYLYRYKSLDHLTAIDSSLARVTCETNQVLLADGQVFLFVVFFGISRFRPT